MLDVAKAKLVELYVDSQNKVWLNVDGVCVARVGQAELTVLEVAGGIKPRSLGLRGMLSDLATDWEEQGL